MSKKPLHSTRVLPSAPPGARLLDGAWVDRADEGADAEGYVFRADRGVLRKPFKDQNGFIHAEGIGAVAGVHTYWTRGADGKPKPVRELIDDETLLQDAGQIGRLPMCFPHPERTDDNPGAKVTSDNYDKLATGDVGSEVHYEEDAQGGYVRLAVTLRRRDAVEAFERGDARELSFGYRCRVDATPGVHPKYGPYDQRQTDRIYNHLAQVPQARHGREAALRADALPAAWATRLDDGGGVMLHVPKSLIARKADDDGRPSNHRKTQMDPTWNVVAALFGIARLDGDSDEDFKGKLTKKMADMKAKEEDSEKEKKDAYERGKADGLAEGATLSDAVAALAAVHLDGDDAPKADAAPAEVLSAIGAKLSTAQAAAEALRADAEAAQADLQKRADADRRAELEVLAKARGVRLDSIGVKDDSPISDVERALAKTIDDKIDADTGADYIGFVLKFAGNTGGQSTATRRDARYSPKGKSGDDNPNPTGDDRSDGFGHPQQKHADTYRHDGAQA